MRKLTVLSWLAVTAVLHAQSQPTRPLALPKLAPTVDQILSLERAGSPEMSPDGRFVAYTVRTPNWDDNEYLTQIWLADVKGAAAPRKFTIGKKSRTAPGWSGG